MAKLVLTIDLGNIPRTPLELAKPMLEDSLKNAMQKQFEQTGFKPQEIKVEFED